MGQEYPSLFGVAPSWADVGIKFPIYGGEIIATSDIAAISASDSLEFGVKRGTSGGKKTARTTGQEDCECSVTFYRQGLVTLVRALMARAPTRNGRKQIGLVGFDILTQHTPPRRHRDLHDQGRRLPHRGPLLLDGRGNRRRPGGGGREPDGDPREDRRGMGGAAVTDEKKKSPLEELQERRAARKADQARARDEQYLKDLEALDGLESADGDGRVEALEVPSSCSASDVAVVRTDRGGGQALPRSLPEAQEAIRPAWRPTARDVVHRLPRPRDVRSHVRRMARAPRQRRRRRDPPHAGEGGRRGKRLTQRKAVAGTKPGVLAACLLALGSTDDADAVDRAAAAYVIAEVLVRLRLTLIALSKR